MGSGRNISKKPAAILLFLWALVLFPAGTVHPQEKPISVAIEVMAPCVMKSGEAYAGFETALWEEISKILGLEYAYYETDMNGIFRDLVEGNAHVGFSCITITDEREERVDFSHHTLDSGLRILVSSCSGVGISHLGSLTPETRRLKPRSHELRIGCPKGASF